MSIIFYIGVGASLLSINIINNIISGTVITLSNISSLLSSSSKYAYYYNNQITELDLSFKLSILSKWLEDHKPSCENNPMSYDQQIYWGIKNVCEDIDVILGIVEEKINVHNTKWLSYYRTLDLEDEVRKLKKYSSVLDERIKLIVLL